MKVPTVPAELSSYITGAYVEMRRLSRGHRAHETTFTSPRTLLAILRLATALVCLNNVFEKFYLDL